MDRIMQLYDEAVRFQKQHSRFHWEEFNTAAVFEEIHRKEIYKIVVDHQTACVFKMQLNDPAIWGEKDAEPSVYLHRISSGKEFRGYGFMHVILEWAKAYGKENKRQYVRIDTWAQHKKLSDYYMNIGFDFVETRMITPKGDLEPHYIGELSLFQLQLK